MAYTKHFIAFNREDYELSIGGTDVSGTLPLAADPIATDEDSDTDMFMPVRTQSGYIRLVSTDRDTWRSLIPQNAVAMPVTLKRGTDLIDWQGYVQTGTYGMKWPATYEQIELPIADALATLDAFDVEVLSPSQWGLETIGSLLYRIFSNLTGLQFRFYFQAPAGTTRHPWITYKFNWRNLLSAEGGKYTSKFSCLGVLQELCKLFGWTCRSKGTGIYFTAATDPLINTGYVVYTLAQLATVSSSGTYPTAEMTDISVLGDDYASADHQEEYVPGIKTATVNSELNAYDVLVEVPYDKIFNIYKYETVTQGTRHKDAMNNPIDCYYKANESKTAGGSFTYENDDVSISTYTETYVQNASSCFGMLQVFDEDMSDDKTSYGWQTAIVCFRSEDYGNRRQSTPLFTMTSKRAFVMADGVIYIDFSCDRESGLRQSATCELRVGIYYWNGTAWTTTPSTFTLYAWEQGVEDTKALDSDADYDGWGIPVTTTMMGDIRFSVIDVLPLTAPMPLSNGYLPLMNLKIGFVRNRQDDDCNEINYTQTGGAFPERRDVDTIFCTDKRSTVTSGAIRSKMGYGMLISDSEGIVDQVAYGQQQYKPEQRTADLIAAYGSRPRQVLTLDLWERRLREAGPASRVTVGQQVYVPVAVSHRWRDGIVRLTLMELPQS